jgi:hypothetical protein
MMKKIFSILLALALVLSFSVVVTPVSAAPGAELTANITAPANNVSIVSGREFTVSANVTNIGDVKAENVTATIGIGSNAILKPVAGNVATKSIATLLAANATAAVNWTLVCTGEGAVNITVTPSGIDFVTGGLIVVGRLHPDTVSINQQKILRVTIVAPPEGKAYNVTNEFEVTANVTNISSLNATNVKLTISIDRYAAPKAGEVLTRTVGPLGSNVTSSNFTWTLTCTGDGFSRITVSPSGNVANEVGEPIAIPAVALTPATVTVRQGVFEVANITLAKGWNLISLPLIPLDSAIDAVLAGILDNVISVWYWDAATGSPWKSFAPGAPSSLLTMEDGKAYWVNMKALRTLQLAGTAMPKGTQLPRAYNVVVGWNMVGFKSTADNVTAQSYLAGTEYVRIYGFNSGAWFTIPGPSYNTTMVPGLGYWVAFTKPGTIYP